MKSAQEWFDEYAVSHQNPTNKLIHWICVPTIFFSIIGLLVSIPSESMSTFLPEPYQAYFNVGTIVILLGLIFYFSISKPLFLGMILFSAFTLWGNVQLLQLDFMPLWLFSIIIFVAAWIGQFIGHHIEGAKPSFFKDLQFLLVGPAWLMGFIYKAAGMKY
tara:strand:+ start:1037 stop:1519 length:483 start_codon:yes stop_codon:yes gene_type:complete